MRFPGRRLRAPAGRAGAPAALTGGRPPTAVAIALGALLLAATAVSGEPRAPTSGAGRPVPVPVALVEVWARRAPLSGLRCSGLVVGDVLVTARHCVGGRLLVVTGSLCDVETAGVALTVPPAGPAPPRPSDDDLAPLPLPLRGLAPPPLRRGTPPRLRHGTPPRLAAAREGADAIVVGYGIDAMDGRVACLPASFRGTLRRCAAPGAWCLAAPPRGQLCGGSSGAPVLVEAGDGWDLAGVVSGGPRCGQAGDVVVATTG